MAKDIIGNANGMNFFVGSDKPAMANAQTPTTIVQPATQNTQTPVVTAPSLTTSINVPKTVPTQALTANVTNFDLNKTLAQNQQVRNQFLQALNNTSDLDKARQQNTDAYNTLQNFDVSVEGGLQKIMNKPIALDFQQGQQAALTRDAAFTRSSLARKYEATGLNLQNIQQQRSDILQQYQYLMQFGQEDVNTGFKLEELRRADEKLKYDQREAAKDFALKQQVTQPFYAVGGTVYRASDGKAYATPDEAFADGVAKNFSNVQQNITTPEDRQMALQRDQLASSKYQVTSDAYGNPMVFNTKTGELRSVNLDAVDQTAPDGATGGQCGVFAHTICDFPTVGNTLAEKQATVDSKGIPADQWREEGAQPGDVLIFNIGQYGHVSVVTQDNGDGTVTVKDSNYGLDEKIQTRTVSKDDKTIYGVIRGQLKDKFTSPAQGGAPLYSDVPIKLRPQVEKIASNFDNEAIVKKYNTVAEGYGFVQGIDNNTKNPADNQALISAFAKALDPESVVREGEYNIVQKYSQSWLESFGFNAMRVFNNQEFLTPQAIQNMKKVIASKYEVADNQYQNLYKDYGRRINAITGKSNGTDYLPNYAQGVTEATNQPESPEAAYVKKINGGGSSSEPTLTPSVPLESWHVTPLTEYIKNLFK